MIRTLTHAVFPTAPSLVSAGRDCDQPSSDMRPGYISRSSASSSSDFMELNHIMPCGMPAAGRECISKKVEAWPGSDGLG
ncbi:MAG TPA: hypothetical protein VF490_03660 [Chryseosolibacter sp.]